MKVRFAPSPTGYLHIGGARTALFNWMYAKAQGGAMILRIEDTDQERSKQEYVDEIVDSMKWLGLSWDEIYYQSKRFDLYCAYAQRLLEEQKAYKEGEAIVFKMPKEQIKLYDLIRGEIVFDTETIKDQVLIKSDGSPTYSFACVIDDALMEISCVVRGEDHISNTPKQIAIYKALGFNIPKYAHLPLIMGEEGGRLSKRTGAVAVSDYRKMGFLPEAIINYLMLLGWSPGNNQEMIAMDAAVKKFSIKKINKAAAIFSMDKLKWLNGQYIKTTETSKLADLIKPFLEAEGYNTLNFDRQGLENIVNLFKGRLSTLRDLIDWADFLFADDLKYDSGAQEEHLSKDRSKEFLQLREAFGSIDPFSADKIETSFRQVVEGLGLKASELVHPVRVALTGKAVGPGLFETIAVLGKEKSLKRLAQAFSSK